MLLRSNQEAAAAKEPMLWAVPGAKPGTDTKTALSAGQGPPETARLAPQDRYQTQLPGQGGPEPEWSPVDTRLGSFGPDSGKLETDEAVRQAQRLRDFVKQNFAALSGGDGSISLADLKAARNDKRFGSLDQTLIQRLQAYASELQTMSKDANDSTGITLNDLDSFVSQVEANPDAELSRDLSATFRSPDAKANQLAGYFELSFDQLDPDKDGQVSLSELDQRIDSSKDEDYRAKLLALRAHFSELGAFASEPGGQAKGISLRDMRAFLRQSAAGSEQAKSIAGANLDKPQAFSSRELVSLIRDRFAGYDGDKDQTLSAAELNKALADPATSAKDKAMLLRIQAYQQELAALSESGGKSGAVHRDDLIALIQNAELKPETDLAKRFNLSDYKYKDLSEFQSGLDTLAMPKVAKPVLTGPGGVQSHPFQGKTQDALTYKLKVGNQTIEIIEPYPLPEGVKLASKEELAQTLAAMPESLRKHVKTVTINPVENPTDAEKRKANPNYPGSSMSAGSNNITVYPNAAKKTQLGLYTSMMHEGAHLHEDAWEAGTKAKWEAAMKADIASPSAYARESLSEDYAETVKLYLLAKHDKNYEQIKAQYPNRFALLEKMGL